MKYRYEIGIKPCVNFATHAAEVAIIDDTYDSKGQGIVVSQRHIATCATNEEAERKADEFCQQLAADLKAVCVAKVAILPKAKP